MFTYYLTVWGVEPIVTHQTSWLVSTGACGVQENQAGGSSVQERAQCTVVGSFDETSSNWVVMLSVMLHKHAGMLVSGAGTLLA